MGHSKVRPMWHNGIRYGEELSSVDAREPDELAFHHIGLYAAGARARLQAAPLAIDIGCGSGDYAGRLAEQGCEVHGYDQQDSTLSFKAINDRLGSRSAFFHQIYLENLCESDFPDRAAALIIINRVGHFLSDRAWENLFDKIMHKVDADTRIAVNFMSCNHMGRDRTCVRYPDDDDPSAEYYLRSTRQFTTMLERIGLEVEHHQPHSHLCLMLLRPAHRLVAPQRNLVITTSKFASLEYQ